MSEMAATAAAAAKRIAEAAKIEDQLSLFAEGSSASRVPALAKDGERGPGRPAGSRDKRKSELRQYLAARQCRQPEEVLIQMAGLDRRDGDVIQLAMARAEAIIAWANEGADAPKPLKNGTVPDTGVTRRERLDVFFAVLRAMSNAADALLPYGLGKATGDEAEAPRTPLAAPILNVNIDAGGQASSRTVSGGAAPSDMEPPPRPWEDEENQGFIDGEGGEADG
ncbi:MAG: hypothetical protein AAF192_12045 [Pseudomonadota bacterium]